MASRSETLVLPEAYPKGKVAELFGRLVSRFLEEAGQQSYFHAIDSNESVSFDHIEDEKTETFRFSRSVWGSEGALLFEITRPRNQEGWEGAETKAVRNMTEVGPINDSDVRVTLEYVKMVHEGKSSVPESFDEA